MVRLGRWKENPYPTLYLLKLMQRLDFGGARILFIEDCQEGLVDNKKRQRIISTLGS